MVTSADGNDTTYWLSEELNISFNPYEDRLIMRAERKEQEAAHLLLTRRMTLIVLHRLVTSLKQLSGLSKTPTQYWQDVLQMAHQHAMQAKQDTGEADAASKLRGPTPLDEHKPASIRPLTIYLATEVTIHIQAGDQQLLMAFKGLPMPKAMTEPSAHVPVFATAMQVEHVHQLIQFLIAKSQEAQWHMPLDLPWLQSPGLQPTSLGTSVH